MFDALQSTARCAMQCAQRRTLLDAKQGDHIYHHYVRGLVQCQEGGSTLCVLAQTMLKEAQDWRFTVPLGSSAMSDALACLQ